jgi:DNA-binding NarL/FixJ family response regulator
MRVLLADDHRLMMEGVSNLLAAHGIEVVGTAANGNEAVAQALALNPDLILMDLRMPVCDGLEATRLIKQRRPDIRIVMLTTSAEDQDLFAAVECGACGYLLKSISGSAFIDALRGLEEGAPHGPGASEQTSPPQVQSEETNALTDRQTEVLQLVAAGLTYKEVGQRLALSERTVRYHMSEIMDRLHLEHRSQVIAYAGKMVARS